MQTYAYIYTSILSKQIGYTRTNEFKMFYMFGNTNFRPSIVDLEKLKKKEKWWLPIIESLQERSAINKAIEELKLGYIYEKLLDGEILFLQKGTNSEWLQATAKDILKVVVGCVLK